MAAKKIELSKQAEQYLTYIKKEYKGCETDSKAINMLIDHLIDFESYAGEDFITWLETRYPSY
jgi:hypothetical protein